MPSPSTNEPYDVLVAGASFAGLAAVRQLTGRVLLVDRQPLGDGVTSACAAPVRTIVQIGAERSIQQIHDVLVIHTPGGRDVWPLPEPFCTFDYRRCCLEAAASAGVGSPGRAEFRLASVHGLNGDAAVTSAGTFRARLFIDATGPRAALAGQGRPRRVAFGLESEIPRLVEPGLHFYFVPEIRDGYAWAFPCGDATRFGVLSYRGRTKLMPALERFMARFGARPGARHGGFLATGWTPDVAGRVFVTGDAAGHCLPVSGEGIRTAVLAGIECGALVQRVMDGDVSLDEASRRYRRFVSDDRQRYRALLWANLLVLGLPQRWLGSAAGFVARPRMLRWFFKHYLGIFDGDGARAAPEPAPAAERV